jgi:hypothetical protein
MKTTNTMNTMKKKLLYFTLITMVLLLSIHCGKDDGGKKEALEEKNEATATAQPSESLPEAEEPQDSPEDRQVILTINDRSFTRGDFKRFQAARYGDIPDEGELKLTDRLWSRIFDSFLEKKILLFYAEKENISLSAEESKKYRNSLKIAGKKGMNNKAVAEEMKIQKFLNLKIYDPITIEENELQEYYNSNLDEFRKKEEVLLYQILVKDKETAIKIKGNLSNHPEKFAEYAKKDSISMEASKGGLMGYFERGTLPKDMENVVFSLKVNTISPVVDSSYGFHIFKIGDKKKSRLLYYNKVKPQIKDKLMADKLTKAYQDFLENAKNNLSIDINYEQLNFKYKKINAQGDEGDESKK